MAAGWPVGVAGVDRHPVSRGALCPLAFGAHQLNWHPRRLRTVRRRGNTSTWAEAQAAFSKACSEGPLVVIDGYPGRAASTAFENFVQTQGGSYRVVLGPEARALRPYEAWSRVPVAALGYDLENTQTIVSFGAPLLDGWGTPGRFTRLWAERAAGMADLQLRLIQIEESLSRTAARAWKWVAVHSGSEAVLAAGLARVLLEEHLVSARGPTPQLSLAEVGQQTGLAGDEIRNLARMIVERPPVLAIANDDNPSIAALNVVLGSWGARGGIVRRSEHAKSYVSAAATVSSARVLLIDSSVPWDFVPDTDGEVFRFAAWDGGSSKTDWLLPAPGFLEELTDVPTAPTSAVETYAVAPSLVKAPADVPSAAQFLGSIDATLTATEKIIHGRCEELFRRRVGTVHAKETIAVAEITSAQQFEEQLWKGAVWIGEPLRPGSVSCELNEWPTVATDPHPEDWAATWAAPVLPPLAVKLCQESNLREPPARRTE